MRPVSWKVLATIFVIIIGVSVMSLTFFDRSRFPPSNVSVQPSSSSKTLSSVQSSQEPSTEAGLTELPVNGRSPSQESTDVQDTNPFSLIPRSREELPLEGDPFRPVSKEDQRWLDRNGFPNAEQFRTFMKSDIENLRLAAQAGDKIAETIMNAKLLATTGAEAAEAEAALYYDAALGNSFALSMLSGHKTGTGELVEGLALARVAEMRGDYSTGDGNRMMWEDSLDPVQRARIAEESRRIHALFEETRREVLGVNQPLYDPRPLGEESTVSEDPS